MLLWEKINNAIAIMEQEGEMDAMEQKEEVVVMGRRKWREKKNKLQFIFLGGKNVFSISLWRAGRKYKARDHFFT